MSKKDGMCVHCIPEGVSNIPIRIAWLSFNSMPVLAKGIPIFFILARNVEGFKPASKSPPHPPLPPCR